MASISEMLFGTHSERELKRIYPIVDRIEEIAGKRGIPMIQVSLAWLLSKPVVAAPIVGFTDPDRIEAAVRSVDVQLTPEEITYLEELYVPHKVVGAFARGVQNVTSSK